MMKLMLKGLLIFLICQISFGTINRECLILTALLSSSSTDYTAPKVLTFPPVDPIGQARYLSELTDVILVEQPVVRNQCYHGCASNSFATLMDLYIRDMLGRGTTSPPVSANFFIRQLIEMKVFDVLQGVSEIEHIDITGNRYNLPWVIVNEGLLFQTSFNDKSDFNTIAVTKEIRRLVASFLAYRDSIPPPTTSLLNTYSQRVFRKVEEVLDKNFGKLDSRLRSLAQKEVTDIYWAREPGMMDFWPHTFKEYRPTGESLERFLRFLVENKFPTELTYYRTLDLFHKETGAYSSLDATVKVNHKQTLAHAIVVIGMARKRETGEPIIILQNSHGSPEKIFIPMSFLLVYGKEILIVYPSSHRRSIQDAHGKLWIP